MTYTFHSLTIVLHCVEEGPRKQSLFIQNGQKFSDSKGLISHSDSELVIFLTVVVEVDRSIDFEQSIT